MPRLIHLNGPPGIGKSTLARLYADDHPGVLDLDIDLVRALVGGWRDHFAATGAIVRPVALSMARAHLDGGRDVIMPQLLSHIAEIERFEAVAHQAGAEFVEIAVMDGRRRSVERFFRRGDGGDPHWHRQVREVVERGGGQALLARMHDDLTRVLAARPHVVVLPSAEGEVEQTYRALAAILGPGP